MYLTWPFYSTFVHIVVPKNTEQRLAPLCFRKNQSQCAGNFRTWRHPLDVFCNSWVKDQFLAELYSLFQEGACELRSVTIELPEIIGWESTDLRERYPADALEEFRPGNGKRERSALRVRLDRREFLAPMTRLLTTVFDFGADRNRNDEYVAVIRSLYPSEDIGPLEGDITTREGRVFFDWNHPGAPI